jgi:hypothetical protein
MRNQSRRLRVKPVAHEAGYGMSFSSGLFLGLASAMLFFANKLPRPVARSNGLDSDWRAVGGYLRSAMRRHGG